MSEQNAMLGEVTVELDSGPLTMTFAYAPVGRSHYSDVPSLIGESGSEQEAVLAGAQMLAIGNWWSFRVEKRYSAQETDPQPAADAETAALPGEPKQ